MTLFLSFNQPIIFLLFVYLGLVSGVVFNIFSFISNILFIKLKKGLKKPVLNKKASKFKQEVEKTNKTQNKPQKQTQNNIVKNIIKNLNKTKKGFLDLFKYIVLFIFKKC